MSIASIGRIGAGITRRRGVALVAAVLVLAFAMSADAKKKKKKHKSSSSKTSTSQTKEAPEPDEESGSGASKEKEEKEDEAKAPPPKAEAPAGEGAASAGGVGEGEGEALKPKRKSVKMEAAVEPEAALVSPALELLIGGGGLWRNLTWNPQTGPLPPYSLAPGPEVRVALEVYPGAFATAGIGADVGIFGHFDYGFGVTSKTMAGATLTTKFQDFLVGLKFRIPLGTFVPWVSVGYGGQQFDLSGTGNMVPGVDYTFVRGALGTRIRFTSAFDLDVGGGYLYVTDPGSANGEIRTTAYFPKATANGAEVGLSLGYRVTSLIAVRVGADFRQYGLAFSTQPTDPLPVGGATDRYITAWGGLELVFDGLGGASGTEAAEAKPADASPAAKPKHRRQTEPDLSDDAAE